MYNHSSIAATTCRLMIHLTYKLQDGGYKAEPQKKIHSVYRES